MSKHENQSPDSRIRRPNFADFWRVVCEQVGNHRLAINPDAQCERDLLHHESIHADYVKELVVACFALSQRAEHGQVDFNALLDHMGELALGLRESENDDLMDIELLEEITWVINTHYTHCLDPLSLLRKFKTNSDIRGLRYSQPSMIISFDQFKSRAMYNKNNT